jgi:hypothetical protein
VARWSMLNEGVGCIDNLIFQKHDRQVFSGLILQIIEFLNCFLASDLECESIYFQDALIMKGKE